VPIGRPGSCPAEAPPLLGWSRRKVGAGCVPRVAVIVSGENHP